SELLDVRADERHRLRFSAVDHDVARRRDDEKRREPARADVVDVADDAYGFERFAPAAIGLSDDGGRQPGGQPEREREHACHARNYKLRLPSTRHRAIMIGTHAAIEAARRTAAEGTRSHRARPEAGARRRAPRAAVGIPRAAGRPADGRRPG